MEGRLCGGSVVGETDETQLGDKAKKFRSKIRANRLIKTLTRQSSARKAGFQNLSISANRSYI